MKQIIDHTTISYQVYGEGKTIYFIYGLGLNLQSMSNFYEAFFTYHQGIRRVYIDLPGMGNSSIHQSLRSSNDILNCLTHFIELDSNNRTISIVGHSYGGYLTLGLAYLLGTKVSFF